MVLDGPNYYKRKMELLLDNLKRILDFIHSKKETENYNYSKDEKKRKRNDDSFYDSFRYLSLS